MPSLLTCMWGYFFVPNTKLYPQVAPAPQRDPTPTPAPRRRWRRTFDMSSVRRSARLSTTRPMTQMQRAQRNLCRKLGILNDEAAPIEVALQEFVAMFNGPLLEDVDAVQPQ